MKTEFWCDNERADRQLPTGARLAREGEYVVSLDGDTVWHVGTIVWAHKDRGKLVNLVETREPVMDKFKPREPADGEATEE